jgi:hypothetical protein
VNAIAETTSRTTSPTTTMETPITTLSTTAEETPTTTSSTNLMRSSPSKISPKDFRNFILNFRGNILWGSFNDVIDNLREQEEEKLKAVEKCRELIDIENEIYN